MGDLICPKCAEPWESYGITYAKGEGDLNIEEANRFLRGEGCPACKFGTVCPRCNGGKIEKNGCKTCFGDGYVFAKRCPTARDGRFRKWFIGYSNSPTYPLRFFEEIEILSKEPAEESQDGLVFVAKIQCPDCQGRGEPCTECNGDGKFHADRQPDCLDDAVRQLLDNSDEEPIEVLTRFVRM